MEIIARRKIIAETIYRFNANLRFNVSDDPHCTVHKTTFCGCGWQSIGHTRCKDAHEIPYSGNWGSKTISTEKTFEIHASHPVHIKIKTNAPTQHNKLLRRLLAALTKLKCFTLLMFIVKLTVCRVWKTLF